MSEWQGGGTDRRRNPERVKELEAQLAAEREKFAKAKDWNRITEIEINNVRTLKEENEQDLVEERRIHGFTKQSLEETRDLVQQLRDQLAAERDKRGKVETWNRVISNQLAAEREHSRQLKARLQDMVNVFNAFKLPYKCEIDDPAVRGGSDSPSKRGSPEKD